MKKLHNLTFLIFYLILFLPWIIAAEPVWQMQNSGLVDLDTRLICVSPAGQNLVCAHTAKYVYFSCDNGNSWQNIFSLAGQTAELNFVCFDFVDPQIIYLATSQGLLVTKDQGQNWQKIFQKVNSAANHINWISQDPRDHRQIYLGTAHGLYHSSDSGNSWQKITGGLPDQEVRAIAIHPNNSQVLYLANSYGLFKSIDRAGTWKRIFVTSQKRSVDDSDDPEGPNASSDEQNLINCIAIDRLVPKRVFIATTKGIMLSEDSGQTWARLPTHGLEQDNVNFIVITDQQQRLYAATQDGVFVFLTGLDSWQEIYQGLGARAVNSLAINTRQQQLFAATNRGVFKIAIESIPTAEPDSIPAHQEHNNSNWQALLTELSQYEPTIHQIQEAALHYGEVIHPDQIRNLRRNARLKALLPDISVDYDKTIQAGGTGSNFGDFVIGPKDWGLSFSWDVGDLVFSEQLRLIDTNARLAVQLRDDILNEATRLYYERRKLQTELIISPPESSREKFTNTLRLQELTANIDALTGGYLSEQLKKKGRR